MFSINIYAANAATFFNHYAELISNHYQFSYGPPSGYIYSRSITFRGWIYFPLWKSTVADTNRIPTITLEWASKGVTSASTYTSVQVRNPNKQHILSTFKSIQYLQ